MWSNYKEMYFNSNDEKYIIAKRLEMVRKANQDGIKKTARFYACSKNTVKKWTKRYAVYGMAGLNDLSRKPKNSHNKIAKEDIQKISENVKSAMEKKKHITVNNIRKKSGVKNYSDATINRYINIAAGKKKNRKHNPSNGGDISFKSKLKPFELIQIDIKYLTDIDNLKPYFACASNNYKGLKAKYQITARDVASGYSIVSYCEDKSLTYTEIFIRTILHPFLNQFKYLDLKKITIQTDCGSEFTNKLMRTKNGGKPNDTSFTIFINDKFKKHKTNIPGHCTADSEVESFHWSIERDCLAWDDIYNNDDLIKYTSDYIKNYNNSIIKKRGYSPLQKINEVYDMNKIVQPTPLVLNVSSSTYI